MMIHRLITAAGAAAFLCGTATMASAGFVFLSKGGNDANDCLTPSSPCLTIGHAQSVASGLGGVQNVIFISSGGWKENVSVTASTIFRVSGSQAVIIVSPDNATPGGSGDLITINVPGANASVKFFDVWLGGNGQAGQNGINVQQVGRLELHNTQVRGFNGNGVQVWPLAGTADPDVYIIDSDIAELNTTCLSVKPQGGSVAPTVAVKNSQIHHCGSQGVRSDATLTTGFVRTLVSNSIITKTPGGTITAVAPVSGGGTARVVVENTDVLNSTTGLLANGGNAQIVLNGATVMGHSLAVNMVNNGNVFSYGNNVVQFNADDGAALFSVNLK
ncbi:MAG: hypothetical protein HY244_04040 [Rhizobiales bacterium]|nr:hypothetical protein [Hyphomicrobiales bacterium]